MIVLASIVSRRFRGLRGERDYQRRCYFSGAAVPDVSAIGRSHSSNQSLVRETPFVIEQPFLTPQAAAVTTKRTIRSNDTMTGNNDADHVLAIGAADRATHLDIAKFLRHPGIRTGFAGWN